MSQAPFLSSAGTLLIHVPTESLELKGVIEHDGLVFFPKKEHHITVIGYKTGKLFLKAFKEDKGLLKEVEDLMQQTKWSWRRSGILIRLERNQPHPLSTIIELVTAPVAMFYGQLLVKVDAVRWPELAAALRSPPHAHITLYTSDVNGVAGIGLDTYEDLKTALSKPDRLIAQFMPPQ